MFHAVSIGPASQLGVRDLVPPVKTENDIAYAIARIRLTCMLSSFRLSVRGVDHTKTVEVRIMKLTSSGSPR